MKYDQPPMNIITFNARSNKEQIDEFIRIEEKLMMTSNEEEHVVFASRCDSRNSWRRFFYSS